MTVEMETDTAQSLRFTTIYRNIQSPFIHRQTAFMLQTTAAQNVQIVFNHKIGYSDRLSVFNSNLAESQFVTL
jgi:hypothetical protein